MLMLRNHEVTSLKVIGNLSPFEEQVQETLRGLEEGRLVTEVGAEVVAALDVRTIRKAHVDRGNKWLTLYGGEDGTKSLSFWTEGSNAEEILQTILSLSGKSFSQSREDVGVIEALAGPASIGMLAGLGWFALYYSAASIEAGEQVKFRGRTKAFFSQLGYLLGTSGVIVVGVVLLALVLVWGFRVIRKRPQRTVWVPEAISM
ncbi:MAG: hypothetical protein KIT22_13495 [Verrucomicrobiae bacterium]|nr:hypothetical protein [Verrucomicrobiae bacterium]